MTTAPSVAQSAPKNIPGIAPEARARLQVRVYDAEMMPAADQTVALRAAAGVLAAAGIDVTWVHCGSAAPDAICATPIVPAELSVRFVRLPGLSTEQGQLQLGYSLVDTVAHDGTLATVYTDRVEWLAAQAGAKNSTLLGFAVAHELGHLLLGTNVHAASGLMRAIWSRTEIHRAEADDWAFSKKEAAAMRTSLERRNSLRSAERDGPGCTVSRDDHSGATAECARTALASLRGVAAGGDR